MGIYKIICAIFAGIFFLSCNQVSKQEYDELFSEYQVLKESGKTSNADVVRQYKNVNHILRKLEGISGRLNDARQNIEGTHLSEIEQIDAHIAAITNELMSAREKTNKKDSPELYKTIEHLQHIIADKQNEITFLKAEIANKDTIIAANYEHLEAQDITIRKQNEDIQLMQMNGWYDMGCELYNVYAEYKDISGGLLNNNNKKRMEENKRHVLLKAMKCFKEAEKLGHPDGQSQTDRMTKEMSSL